MHQRHRHIVVSCLIAAAIIAGPAVDHARAAEFDVPVGFATIQLAVDAAELSADVENYINIGEAVHFTTGDVTLNALFNGTRRLTIRPDPDVPLERAMIACTNGFVPIFRFEGAGFVTIQDLDIVRYATNANNLIQMIYPGVGNNDITIERCRIGSIWTTSGSPGWSYIHIWQPTRINLRNNIFFSYVPGTFDYGLRIENFGDPDNSILLYNNDVADHKLYGIRIEDDFPGTVLILRNNVVANTASIAPEPFAYQSDVVAGVTVQTSHNVAFATGAFVESQLGAQSILAGGAGTFILLARPLIGAAFVDASWNLAPPWDPNADFYRLRPLGPLNDMPADYGQIVDDGVPFAEDVEVADDWERDPRPSGTPSHFDRGADQIKDTVTGTPMGDAGDAGDPRRGVALWTAPIRNPAPAVGVQFRAAVSGELRFEVFDVVGRRLFEESRAVNAGTAGILESHALAAQGVHYYRVTLRSGTSAPVLSSGKVTIVR
jgi:hypothetical protein